MKRILLNTFSLLALLILGSCSILDEEPQVICSDTYYQNESEVLYGLAGVYGAINNEELYGRSYSLPISNTDDLCYQNRPHNTSAVYWYTHNASDSDVLNAWRMLYAGIKNANEFMMAVEHSEFDPDGLYYQEARFLRAFYHFLLAQAWGDVPLRERATLSPDPEEVNLAATPQAEVLMWCAKEMEEALPSLPSTLENAPSRVVQTTAAGMLARLYLFMAGETVALDNKTELFEKAAYWAKFVIDSGLHFLNPDYEVVFQNMITDTYDKTYNESMWEADFLGDRTSADSWSNGRIGDLIGLQSTSAESDFSSWKCNYSYAQYNGSLKLWDLYWSDDRTDEEKELPTITDRRQEWNLPPYNYKGGKVDGVDYTASKDKTPYIYSKVTTFSDPTVAVGIRNCGKWRREVEFEGAKSAKNLYTTINFPILRYSDVLLMYAEAMNEAEGPSEELWGYVKQVRDRAGVATRPYGEYSSQGALRELIRNERGRELCFEALRKYDLIRWGIFVEAMRSYNQQTADTRWEAGNTLAGYALQTANSVQPKHIYLPIPTKELGVNTALKQNPMW
uniref:RagB/SusD family nutrient uptake outer membrane protein n=1 Tax=Alistipes sp. TaxID=1872444 RepID=UPI004057448A